MKNAFVIVTLSGLISACAVAPAPQPVAMAAPVEALAPAAASAAPEADPEESGPDPSNLPKVQLTSALLYKLMKAELEFQNGAWQGPYMTLLGLAQQTRDPRLAQRAADIAMSAKRTVEANVAVALWRELAPDSDEATQYYLGLALMTDDLGEAGRIFERRLRDAGPAARGVVMFQVQQYLARVSNRPGADLLLAQLLAPYADSFEANVLQAQAAFARDDGEPALRHAQAALALKPDSELAILTLAQVTPDQQAVGVLLDRFLVLNPKAREVRTAYARVLVTQKRYASARTQFEAMLAEQPDSPGTLYALGIMSMQLGENRVAEDYFARFIALLDQNPDEQRDTSKVLLILSELAEERGDLKAASRWLGRVGEDDQASYFAAQIKRGQLMAGQGDLAGARAFLAALKTDEPAQQAQLLVTEAHLLREAGNSEAAYALLADGARRFPANPDLLYDFALLAEKTGRLDVMETSLRAVMAAAPDNHHAYNALGYSLAERNVRLPEALALIDKAMKMAPGDPFIMDSMGWVQYRLGNLAEAEANLRRAYALRADVDIAVHLGEVLWHQGRKADAQQLWREARAKDPKNDTLKSTLARLHTSL
ncbi:MAG: tetratricopeptide repeat protein [Pseudomonadota bacterium]